MKNLLLVLVSLLSTVCYAQQSKRPANKSKAVSSKTTSKVDNSNINMRASLKSANDSASYAIGVKVADMYSKQGIKSINSALLTKGVNDFMIAKQPALTDEQADVAIYQITNPAISSNIKSGLAFLAENKLKPGIITTRSGLQYQVINEGNGAKPTLADTVTVHYAGRLLDGKEFDSSYKRNAPITFDLPKVIKGWGEGLQLMAPGSKYKFYIPYSLGYGTTDRPRIPAGSTLVFDVELISVKKKQG